MLRLEDVHVDRGDLPVLRGITLEAHAAQITALIGANGAGKTTTLGTISGLLPCRQGRILFRPEPGETWQDLRLLKPAAIVAAGIVHCPEGRQIFGNLSVGENLTIGAFRRADRDAISRDRERILDLFPILRERAGQPGTRLSGGEQMMLAVGRALMARPRLLLLDEPSLGLAPRLIEQVFDIIERLRAEGTTILLVEQNAAMALEVADRAYVLETGRIALAGSGAELAADSAVRDAYLGAA